MKIILYARIPEEEFFENNFLSDDLFLNLSITFRQVYVCKHQILIVQSSAEVTTFFSGNSLRAEIGIE